MSREVVFYGERGILNSIILDTQGDIGKQKQFLRSIVLADKSKLDWVDDVRMIKYFVEPCFDQFGNPDMLIEAITKNNDKYVLFIETKLNSYECDALNMEQLEEINNEYLPKSYKNSCDKINIKLSILYRFIQAYKNNLSDDKNINSIIAEKEDAVLIYNDETKRKLENWIMIEYWHKNFKDAKEYYFIALTNDLKEIIEDKNLNSDLFPYNNNKIIPPIGSKQWDLDKGKFGITTYDTLLDKKVISKQSGYYKDTSDLMLFHPPTITDYQKNKELHALVSIDADRWNESQQELYNLIKNMKELDLDFKLFIKNFMESIEYN